MKRGHPGDWHITGTLGRESKSYNLSAVLSSWRLLLYYAYADGPKFSVIAPAEICNKCLPHGPVRSISMTGALWCVHPCYVRFLRNIKKQGTIRLKTVQFMAEKKLNPQTLKCSWRSSQKYCWAWTLKWRFLEGVCRPLLPYLFSLLYWVNVLRRYRLKHGEGHTLREWWRRKISLRSFDRYIAWRLHSPPIFDNRWNQLGYSTDGVGYRLSTQPSHGYYPA